MTQTIIIRGDAQRQLARRLIDAAPLDGIVQISEPKRNADQNARMWAMLSDISRAKPDGRRHTPDVWKALFMNACGYEVQFLHGLDGNPFPAGFRTSKLTVRQMADLITYIGAWGDDRHVRWSEPTPQSLAA